MPAAYKCWLDVQGEYPSWEEVTVMWKVWMADAGLKEEWEDYMRKVDPKKLRKVGPQEFGKVLRDKIPAKIKESAIKYKERITEIEVRARQDFMEVERDLILGELKKANPRHQVDMMDEIFWLSEEAVKQMYGVEEAAAGLIMSEDEPSKVDRKSDPDYLEEDGDVKK